jgi:sugar phosphate isomerase/epimerase
MAQTVFHPSIEGAQHGAKSLSQFLDFARKSGAAGAQPSNYMLQDGKGFKTAKEIRSAFEKANLSLDGISAHCPFWVHTTAWTGSPTIRPFIPAELAGKPPAAIEKWAEGYLLSLLDLCAELGVKVVPMFWGVVFGWEVATGYPWGFWKGADYDLIQEGRDRFVKNTARLREHARQLGVFLCHEIHPGTGAMCADDFNLLVKVCDGDPCLAVNADPSHCWEGESWETRFSKVASRIYACHVKNFVIRRGHCLRKMESAWPNRGMQFVDISSGDLNMTRYAELLMRTGYARRYCKVMRTKTAPLVVEAESAYRDGDATSADGIRFVREHLCFPVAGASFEDGMGAN